jgi:hypothetical protein
MRGVNGVELDTVDQLHLVVQSVDMYDVPNWTKDLGDGLNVLGDTSEIFGRELPDGVVRVGLNRH